MRRTTLSVCGLIATGLLAASTLAEEPKPVAKGTVGEKTVALTAVVEAVDLEHRTVTVKGPNGVSETLEVSEAVRNLPQVKPGDHVKVEYHAALAWEVHKAGEEKPDVEIAGAAARAKPGAKPAGVVGQQATLRATISAIDKDAKTVTLKGPRGNLRTFEAKDPKKLEAVSVGDLVEITYTEALAVSVQEETKEPKQ